MKVFLKKCGLIVLSIVMLWPVLADAQTISGMFRYGTNLLSLVIEILFGAGFMVFLWGIVRFIAAAGDPRKISDAKNFIIWGLVGMAVMVSMIGLIRLVSTLIFGSPNPLPLGPEGWPPTIPPAPRP